MNISKTVRDGTLVVKHGSKYVRCSRRSKCILGAFQHGRTQTLITDAGLQTIHTPTGIVVHGPVRVEVSE